MMLLRLVAAVLLASAFAAAQPTPLGIALESYAYPYPVHFLPLRIEQQDLLMAYMDVPPKTAANGRTVVLLHGKNFGGYYWQNVIAMLTSRGFRVVVPDQIGWGKSSKPDIAYSFRMLARNTATLLDTLQVRNAVILGHSTGGMLAVRFALMYPERVTQLVLEDPLGMEDYSVAPEPTFDELYQTELHTTPERFRGLFMHYFAHPRPEIWEPIADVPIRVTMSGEWARWAKASALAYQMIYEQPVLYEYRRLQPPALIIAGEQDRTAVVSPHASPEQREKMGHFPELARQAAQDMPHGSAVVIPECGHIPHLETPAAFEKALIEFLQ